MPSLRILHLLDRLDGYGPAPWIAELARHTPPETAAHEIVAYYSERAAQEHLADQATCRTLAGRWSWDPVALGRLASILRRRWDVIHIWDEPSWRRHRLLGRRTTPIVYTATTPDSARRACRRRPTQILAPTQADVEQFVREGVAATRVDVAPVGIGAPTPPVASRDALLERLGWPAATRLIVAAGPLVRASRFDDAAWRYELVRLLHADARLAIVGRGPDGPRLARQIRLVSDPQCVQILDDDPWGLAVIGHADVYWQASVGNGPPYELLLAMASGRSIVAADTPVHRRLLAHEQQGYLANPSSRTEFAYWTDRLLSDNDLRETIGRAAAAQADQCFDAGALATRQCQLYRQTCGR